VRKILLIEDDTALVEVITEKLEESGYRVFSTDRMDMALALFAENEIDLVVTDFHIRQGSGRKLLHEIRKLRPTVPVVLITGTPFVGLEDFSIFGFNQVLLKPFSVSELLRAVSTYD
jgi:DNA-binding response OmpR family regulator